MTVLTTRRLRLVPIAPRHLDGLRRINGDPEVMRYLGSGLPESEEATARFAARVQQQWSERPYSWWAFLESPGDGAEDLVGCGPLQRLEGDPDKPHEIGWRIRRNRWGLGYAPEAARAIANYAFTRIKVPVLLAVTVPANTSSIRVMQKIGMRRRGIETHDGKPCMTFEMKADHAQAH